MLLLPITILATVELQVGGEVSQILERRHAGLEGPQLVDLIMILLEPLKHVFCIGPVQTGVTQARDSHFEGVGILLNGLLLGIFVFVLVVHAPPLLHQQVQVVLVHGLGGGVEWLHAADHGCLEASHPDAEGLGFVLVQVGLVRSRDAGLDLLGRQVCLLFLEDSLVVVGCFGGEGEQVGDLDLTLLVDENVVGADIPDLGGQLAEVVCGGHQRVEQVPDFGLIKVAAQLASVLEFVGQDIRVVIEVDLREGRSTLMVPEEPQMALRA